MLASCRRFLPDCIYRTNTMNQKVRLLCILALTLALTGCSTSTIGPLWKSNDKIRASILKQTPLGTPKEQVEAFIKQQPWTASDNETRVGDLRGEPGVESIISYDIGTTHFSMFPFATDVIAYWGFDWHGRLVDVSVVENTNAQ